MMIHEFARCPYCKRGVLAVDDAGPTFIFEPDRVSGKPCPHLALATVGFEAGPRKSNVPAERVGVWRWSYGDCLHGPKAQGDELGDYLTDLACDGLPYAQLVPEVAYQLVGVNAEERETARKGWGYFPVESAKAPFLGWYNGWALYSQAPAALIRDVYKRLDLWTQLSADEPQVEPVKRN